MKIILKDVRHEAPGVLSFIFRPEASFVWQAGQFMRVRLPYSKDEPSKERYFSIATAPYERGVMMTINLNNLQPDFKEVLESMPTGEFLEAEGPEGDFVINDPTEEMVFIADGVGITPFRAILFDLDHRNIPIHLTLLYSNQNEKYIYREELELISRKHDGFKIKYFSSPQKISKEDIEATTTDIIKPTFYISGPEPMAVHYEELLTQMGVPPHHRRTDFFKGKEWR